MVRVGPRPWAAGGLPLAGPVPGAPGLFIAAGEDDVLYSCPYPHRQLPPTWMCLEKFYFNMSLEEHGIY